MYTRTGMQLQTYGQLFGQLLLVENSKPHVCCSRSKKLSKKLSFNGLGGQDSFLDSFLDSFFSYTKAVSQFVNWTIWTKQPAKIPLRPVRRSEYS